MKIAIACAADIWNHNKYSGAEKTIGYRAKALDLMGHEVHLYCLADWPYTSENGKFIHWTGDANLINVEDYDIIDNNGSTEFYCSHVLNTINGPFWPNRNVVAISHSQGVGMGFKSFRVAHYGVDVDRYIPDYNKEDYFIYFGRAYPGKHPEIAVRLAKEMGFNLILICEDRDFCDDKNYVESLKRECENNSNIRYLGPRFGPELMRYIQKAKAFIFPQDHGEAFGLVMLEALACGTPVIVGARNGAPPEVIDNGRTGFLCHDFDHFEDFKKAIRNIDQISPRECRIDAENRWSGKANALRYLELSGSVISGESW